ESAGSTLYILNAFHLADLLYKGSKFLFAAHLKAYGNRRLILLADTAVDILKINLPFREYFRKINKKSCTVIRVDLKFCRIFLRGAAVSLLPFRFDQPDPVRFGHIQDVDAVGTVDGDPPSSGNEAHDLVARDRT